MFFAPAKKFICLPLTKKCGCYVYTITTTTSTTTTTTVQWSSTRMRVEGGWGRWTPCQIFNPRSFYIFSPRGRLTPSFCPQVIVTIKCIKPCIITWKCEFFLGRVHSPFSRPHPKWGGGEGNHPSSHAIPSWSPATRPPACSLSYFELNLFNQSISLNLLFVLGGLWYIFPSQTGTCRPAANICRAVIAAFSLTAASL